MPRLGQEYLTSNRFSAYPFDSNSSGLVYDPAAAVAGLVGAKLPADFLLDAYVEMLTDYDDLYLRTISWNGAVFTVTFATDDALAVAATTTLPDTATIRADMNDGYYVWEVHIANKLILRASCDEGFTTYLDAVAAHGDAAAAFTDDTILFADSAVVTAVPSVETFGIYSDISTPIQTGIDGDVQFIPGYNVAMTIVDSEDDTTDVQIDATPGSGLGEVPCDEQEEEEPVETPMGLTPDVLGAIRIEGDECYEIVPNRGLNTITIHGVCYACCACEDYVAVGEALGGLMSRTHTVRTRLDQINSDHDDAIDDYETRHFPELRRGYLSVQAFRGIAPGADKHGTVSVKITNKGETEMVDVALAVDIGTSQLMGGSYRIGDGASGTCTLNLSGITIPEGESMTATYRVFTTGTALGPVSVECTFTIDARPYTLNDSTEFGEPN